MTEIQINQHLTNNQKNINHHFKQSIGNAIQVQVQLQITKTLIHHNTNKMPKKQKSTPSTRSYKPQTVKTNIGRPQDDQLETFFMKKLRSGKLQAISAQSEAEIQCYQFEDSLINEQRPRPDDNYSEDKLNKIHLLFEGIDQKRFNLLWQSFIRSAQRWEFQQITSVHDFPEYLFCDECDLCYVLHFTLNSDIDGLKEKTDFANDQLLFLQLLCFAARDQISFRVIKSIEINFEAIIKMMENVKTFVLKYSKEQTIEEKSFNNPQTAADDAIPRSLRKGDVKDLLHKVDSSIESPQKSKKIEKPVKDTKKRGRPKKLQQEVREDKLLSMEELEKIAQRLINHIVRAYAYIYPEELKKKKILNAVTASKGEIHIGQPVV